MSNLTREINRFFYRNRNKGIPRLMLWICIGNAIVYLFSNVNAALPKLLCFDAELILHGQIWRLFSYIFTFACYGSFLGSSLLGAAISILFYYWVGNMLENTCGTLHFNLFYLCGILISDVVALLIYWLYPCEITFSSHALNLSMYLAVATLVPESKVYLYMIIPLKMKWMAWVYLGITLYDVGSSLYQVVPVLIEYRHVLPAAFTAAQILIAVFPLVALLNYFLFFGGRMKELMPRFKRLRVQKQSRREARQTAAQATPNPNWAENYRSASGERPYRHKCTVCGRTDTDCPGLEFRYCSRCKGYFCYCIDHINNHTHVE